MLRNTPACFVKVKNTKVFFKLTSGTDVILLFYSQLMNVLNKLECFSLIVLSSHYVQPILEGAAERFQPYLSNWTRLERLAKDRYSSLICHNINNKKSFHKTLCMDQKVKVFVPDKPFQLSLILAGRIWSLPKWGATERYCTQISSNLTCRLVRKKHFSLFCVSIRHKMFYNHTTFFFASYEWDK
jgi:hypothetical protein